MNVNVNLAASRPRLLGAAGLYAGGRALSGRGRQRCEVAAFAPDERQDVAALNLRVSAQSPGINRLLSGGEEYYRLSGSGTRQPLESHPVFLTQSRKAAAAAGNTRPFRVRTK